MRPARLPIHQPHRILPPRSAGSSPQSPKAGHRCHLDTTPRNITAALHRMRDRYQLPTNEALIAAAVKLEWIPLAIGTTDDAQHHD